jgi:hypothetical protein
LTKISSSSANKSFKSFLKEKFLKQIVYWLLKNHGNISLMKFLKAIVVFFLPFTLSAQNYYGGIPALFDDFSYNSTQDYPADSSVQSVFGMNGWHTENGVVQSRAWYSWGWHEHDYGDYAGFLPNQQGITLSIKKGFKNGGNGPWITSGLAALQGTYVTRVRFGELPDNSHTIQAFWLLSPNSYRFKRENDSIRFFSEIDFEWNNFFSGPQNPGGHASYLTAQIEGNNATGKTEQLQFFKKEKNGNITNVTSKLFNGNQSIVANQWYYCVFTIDSAKRKVSYYMQSEPNMAGEIYYGSAMTNGALAPFYLNNYPLFELCPMYSVSFGGKDSNIRESSQEITLDVDWFYYSPNSNLKLDDVLKEVINFRENGLYRINTTGSVTMRDMKNTPMAVEISGPSEVMPFSSANWTLSAAYRSTIMHVEYSYRFLDTNNEGEWQDINETTIILTPNATHTAIELKANARHIWTGEEASTSKRVKISDFTSNAFGKPFPNPTSGIVMLEIPFLFAQQFLEILVYDIGGSCIHSYTSTALSPLPVDLSDLPAGQYWIKIHSGLHSVEAVAQVMR